MTAIEEIQELPGEPKKYSLTVGVRIEPAPQLQIVPQVAETKVEPIKEQPDEQQSSTGFDIPQKCAQRVDKNGRIIVSKKAWVMRVVALIGIFTVAAYNINRGIALGDVLVVYATLVLVHSLIIFIVGWFFYKNPASRGKAGNELVSIIIPVYNQEEMIETVIDAIYNSTYKNIEVVAVNDGSKDGTKDILDSLSKRYPKLKVIHKNNAGKRKAVAAGFYASTADYIVLIDSDSVVDRHAIKEFMKAFNSNQEIGALVGQAKVWNASKNLLTKCQDAWYDYAFNIYKVCESAFGTVTCCSGCLAGYRRQAIANFIPYWAESKIQYSDDRALTNYAIAPDMAKKEFTPIAQKLAEFTSKYDDAEDRMLTVQSLTEWKSVYVASAVVYTDAPENIRGYFKQQQRWKKGYIRSNFFASSFFWRKHPLMSVVFYTDFMTTFTLPLILAVIFVYEPLILGRIWAPVSFFVGLMLVGLCHGLDYKFRDNAARNWKYKPLMNLMSTFVLTWLLFPSLWTLKKNAWLTR